MKYLGKKEREEFQRRAKTYLMIHFRDGEKTPVVERLTAQEIREFKHFRPISFRNAVILKGEVYKGFGSDFCGALD